MKQLNATDTDRAQGVPVITLFDVRVERAILTTLCTGLKRHLDGGLNRGGTIGTKERSGQPSRCTINEEFSKFDSWFVRGAEEGGVIKPLKLRDDRSIDLRNLVPVNIDPQR